MRLIFLKDFRIRAFIQKDEFALENFYFLYKHLLRPHRTDDAKWLKPKLGPSPHAASKYHDLIVSTAEYVVYLTLV